VQIASEQVSLAQAVGGRDSPIASYVPLFWRVLALNAAVVTTMAVAIAIVLPAPFAHIAPDDAAILAVPPGRADRQRTSGRTAAERRKWTSEPADYTLTIVPSNLPKADVSPGS